MTEPTEADTTIRLERIYPVSRAAVFQAFTDPDALRRWYAPVPGWEVSLAEVDLRVGGRYLLHFGPPGGPTVVEEGTYHDVVPDERLVYSVVVGSGASRETTTVTVEFLDASGGCEVRILEVGYSGSQVRDRHRAGWTRMLDHLTYVLPEAEARGRG